MIDDKIWGEFFYRGGNLTPRQMVDALSEKFTCPRCGRPDLPLALFPYHDKSCRFECGHLIIGRAAIDTVEDLNQKLEDAEERIEHLEMAVRDGLTTINWFESWTRKVGVEYTYRGVAHMKNSMCKALGPLAAPQGTDFRCSDCEGLFDRKFMVGAQCEWCRRSR